MTSLFLVLFELLVFCGSAFGSFRKSTGSKSGRAFRMVGAACLIAFAWFGAVQCMGDYEASTFHDRLRWQLEDAGMGIASLFTAALLLCDLAKSPIAKTSKNPQKRPSVPTRIPVQRSGARAPLSICGVS